MGLYLPWMSSKGGFNMRNEKEYIEFITGYAASMFEHDVFDHQAKLVCKTILDEALARGIEVDGDLTNYHAFKKTYDEKKRGV